MRKKRTECKICYCLELLRLALSNNLKQKIWIDIEVLNLTTAGDLIFLYLLSVCRLILQVCNVFCVPFLHFLFCALLQINFILITDKNLYQNLYLYPHHQFAVFKHRAFACVYRYCSSHFDEFCASVLHSPVSSPYLHRNRTQLSKFICMWWLADAGACWTSKTSEQSRVSTTLLSMTSILY